MWGQHLNFHHYPDVEEFNDQIAFKIQMLQDQSGFLWFPTLSGAYRYDGREFRSHQYKSKDLQGLGLSTNITRVIMEDEAGKIWIGTNNGINIYDPRTGLFEYLKHDPDDPESLCGNSIRFIQKDREGNIWVGVSPPGETVCVCDPKTRKFRKTYSPAGESSMLQHSDGSLFFSNPGGLYRYLPDQDTVVYLEKTDPAGKVIKYGATEMIEVANGNIWYTSKRKTKGVFSPANSTFLELPGPIKNVPFLDNTASLFQDRNDIIWFAGIGKVSRYDPEQKAYTIYKHQAGNELSCLGTETTSIFQDKAGSIWFSAYNGGGTSVVHQLENPFEPLNLPAADGFLFLDQRRLLLVNSETTEKAVFDIEDKRLVPSNLPDLFMNNKIRSVVFGEDQTLWWTKIGGENTEIYNLLTGQLKRINLKFKFALDSQHNPWFTGFVMSKYDRDKQEFSVYSDTIYPRKVIVDRMDRVWMGKDLGGLVQYDPKTQKSRSFGMDTSDPKAPLAGRAALLYEDSNGWIYMLTANGLSIYQEEIDGFVNLDLAQGAPQIYEPPIIEDNNENIWLGLSEGLVKINTRDLSIQKFNEIDGLPGGRFASSMAKDQAGRIYFAKDKQIFRFNPEALKPDTTAWPIVFTDFYLKRKPINPLDEDAPIEENIQFLDAITLSYDQSDFGFRFVSPDFKKADQLMYYYQLENYSDEWVATGNSVEAHFTSIPHGNYQFRVKAKTPAGSWTPEQAGIHITILPPWWKTWWAYTGFIFLAAGLIYSLYRYQLRRQLRKQEMSNLKALDTFKNELYTNITHEFRTPLTVISGMADQIVEPIQIKSLIKRNSLNLLNLVNQILDLRKLEVGKLKLDLVQGDVVQYLQYIIASFEVMAELKGVQLHFIPKEKVLFMDFDQEKLLRIISNLLSNAIKFTPKDGNIYLTLRKGEIERKTGQMAEALCLTVSDTGAGIPLEKQAHIFERFYQVEGEEGSNSKKYMYQGPGSNAGKTGSGIGLALTKDLVTLMEGSISLESTPGQGSSFEITLPISREAMKIEVEQLSVDTIPSLEYEQASVKSESGVLLTKAGFPATSSDLSLLIIEDNRDVQQYLITLLESKYTLYLASNGREGIEMAFEYVPDLIISDVMMPEKDGFEVCDTLKNDDRTSHIPIVLLTAKASVESRIQGLERGADAYLAKPFNEKELFVRLEKLADLRRLLQQRYQHIRPPVVAIQSQEEEGFKKEDAFMIKLQKSVEENLDDGNFGPTQLCEAVGMSRSQLHLKIKALTNRSTSIFIRSIRLHKAKELLQQGELSVSQVVAEVGFNDLSYFSRKFKEEFGESPQKVANS